MPQKQKVSLGQSGGRVMGDPYSDVSLDDSKTEGPFVGQLEGRVIGDLLCRGE